ncbi:MAG: DUF2442 domain-containing protein [Planctomycetes bacterium]|nr:DUF2442 domain-containing protein [Planctomycetota bacterium]
MTRDVIDVALGEGHRLILTFAGGERREVDMGAMVSFDGVFEPLKDDAYFRQVRVDPDVGTIVWPNGADICPDVLFEKGRQVTDHAA